MTVGLADVLALMPDGDRKYWLGGEALVFGERWAALGLPAIEYRMHSDKQAFYDTDDTAEISRQLGLSGAAGVSITFEHKGYQACIVQAEKK